MAIQRSTKSSWKRVSLIVVLIALAFLLMKELRKNDGASLKKQKSVINEFNRIYYDSYVWRRTCFLGIPTAQFPTDLWMIQEIITNLKPDYIIETGTYCGGSSLFFADILDRISERGKIITIDIDPQTEKASRYELFRNRVHVIKGNSVSPEVIDQIAQIIKGGSVLVTLDSLHTKEHVLEEMRLYSKFVTPGSYLIVQDTNINGHPVYPSFGPGPMEAVVEFLRHNHDFRIDRSRERYLLTAYPSGFLKKIKR